jgi:hypothetical protein
MSFSTKAQLHTDTQPPHTGRPFSKNILHGFTGRDSLPITRVWVTSFAIPGYAQLYNRQYWKLPILYGSVGGLLYSGYNNNMRYMDTGNTRYLKRRDLCYTGAGIMYWMGLMDGLTSYYSSQANLPQRATILSLMLPGLGQAYNREYWKIPIVYFGMAFGVYYINYNNTQYQRFRTAYNNATDDDPETIDEFNGRATVDNMKYYRDSFRRNRDYAVLFSILFYVMNAVDANVFAHLKQFDVSEDIAMNLRPTIVYDHTLAIHTQMPAIGMKLNINF